MKEHETILTTSVKNLTLDLLTSEDASDVFNLVQDNRMHLTQNGDYQELVSRDLSSTRLGLSESSGSEESFGVFLNDQIIGIVTLIKHAPKICGLGYWVDEKYQGQGFMTASVRSLITYAGHQYQATEIWAGIKHSNSSSIALVTRLGFELKREQESHLSFQLCPINNQNSDE